jgi:hypothetical protein
MHLLLNATLGIGAGLASALLVAGCGDSSQPPAPGACHVSAGESYSYVVTFRAETTGDPRCPDYTNWETANCSSLPANTYPPAWTFDVDAGAITQTSCLVGTESNSAYVASTCAATLDWSNSTLGGCPAEVHEAITFDVNGDFTGTMRISATCAEDGGTDAAGASVVCVYPITSIQPLG